jgi:uncharacterized protein (DUF924 family)
MSMGNGQTEAGPAEAEDVLAFWLGAGPEAWYRQDDAFDAEIAARFGQMWEQGAGGAFDREWTTGPRGALALIVLLDQFPRNMFRGQARAFHSDARALLLARDALDRTWDMAVEAPERQFFYMPFMHSERLADQDVCVQLFSERMPGDNVLHARAHREIIDLFGRFPYRNAALGRATSQPEQAFLDEGGYGKILNDLKSR